MRGSGTEASLRRGGDWQTCIAELLTVVQVAGLGKILDFWWRVARRERPDFRLGKRDRIAVGRRSISLRSSGHRRARQRSQYEAAHKSVRDGRREVREEDIPLDVACGGALEISSAPDIRSGNGVAAKRPLATCRARVEGRLHLEDDHRRGRSRRDAAYGSNCLSRPTPSVPHPPQR